MDEFTPCFLVNYPTGHPTVACCFHVQAVSMGKLWKTTMFKEKIGKVMGLLWDYSGLIWVYYGFTMAHSGLIWFTMVFPLAV